MEVTAGDIGGRFALAPSHPWAPAHRCRSPRRSDTGALPAEGAVVPGDRWCVTAANCFRAQLDGAAGHVVLASASTHERALDIVPLVGLQEHAVDVPPNPAALDA